MPKLYLAETGILTKDTDTNYYGNKEVGKFLREIMRAGATKDWRKLIKEATGSEISAKPMLDYFEPVMTGLKKENKGRKYTLPEEPAI